MISQAVSKAVLLLGIAALFSVSVCATSAAGAQLALKDTVYVTPPNPSTKDSLHFDLFNANLLCCTQYRNSSVTVSDSVILLSFEYIENPACACLVAGSHTAFACGPQKAGKYAIYKEQGIYCATPPCPLVAGPIQLVRVGDVTIGGMVAAGPTAYASVPGNGLNLRQDKRSIYMNYSLSKTAHMLVKVYNTAGMASGQLYNGQAGVGTHRFSWTGTAKSVYFLSVEINGTVACSQKIIILQ
jgi:hypothetical protein